MIDRIRRNMLATGAAATAIATAPQVFAQQARQGTAKFYEKGSVRIAYRSGHHRGSPAAASMGRVASGSPSVFGGNLDSHDLQPGTSLFLPVVHSERRSMTSAISPA
jgi:acetamidase/formamidase